MKALITGSSGFVASHLRRDLLAAGWDVAGMGNLARESATQVTDSGRGSDAAPGGKKTSLNAAAAGGALTPNAEYRADIRDAEAVGKVLRSVAPDVVFHLAGISSVSRAAGDPVTAFDVNAGGTSVLLNELVRARDEMGKNPICLIAGSGEQYGRHPDHAIPLDEGAEQLPVSAYAASKCAQETVALQVWRSHGLPVICVRAFNHSGPGQSPDFLLPALVRRAILLRKGSGGEGGAVGRLALGNMDPVRDFLHVEDVARAYRLLVQRGRPGECYNVCSGKGISVRSVAELVLELAGVDAKLHQDPAFVRPVDIPTLVGSEKKLVRDTDWLPSRSMKQILEDLISAATN